ncbi:Phosphoserine phosphatase [Rhizina undulata]
MSPASSSNLLSSGRPTGLSRAHSYNGAFQLRNLHGESEDEVKDEPEVLLHKNGQTFRIRNSGVIHTVSHKNCIPAEDSVQLIATLFYNSNRTSAANSTDAEGIEIAREDVNYGQHVSEMAMFEFTQMIDELLVPWKKWGSSHRCLDSPKTPRIMEITLSMPEMLGLESLRRHTVLWEFEQKWNVEVVLQANDVFRRYKRLAVFDMDSTLIQQEVIDEIARFVGVEDKVSAITARAMNGELDFTQSLKERVALLKGVPSTVFESLKSVITFTPGARDLCRVLKRLGFKIAVLSGGFIPLANYVKEELGLDYAYANQLVISEDGTELTGEVTGDIVNAERKAQLLEQIAAGNNIDLKQVIAVGDGANDLPMMRKAGLGVAFNAKPAVQLEAPCKLNSGSLRDILYILGFSKEEQNQLLAAI